MSLYTCPRCEAVFEDDEPKVVKCSECGAHFEVDEDVEVSGDPPEYHDRTGLRYLPDYPY